MEARPWSAGRSTLFILLTMSVLSPCVDRNPRLGFCRVCGLRCFQLSMDHRQWWHESESIDSQHAALPCKPIVHFAGGGGGGRSAGRVGKL